MLKKSQAETQKKEKRQPGGNGEIKERRKEGGGEYLFDLVVRFSISLALFTEKPRSIVRKLKAPFRPILPENSLSQ